eukprot:scaffold150567_cov27-Tisochrysis_lutea.AAC.2
MPSQCHDADHHDIQVGALIGLLHGVGGMLLLAIRMVGAVPCCTCGSHAICRDEKDKSHTTLS